MDPRRFVLTASALLLATAGVCRGQQCGAAETAELTASNGQANDLFGSVAIHGDTAVVGAPLADGTGTNAGAAYVFERNAGGPDAWGQVRVLDADDGAAGDEFGTLVAVQGDTIVVTAPLHDANGSNSGAAFVFERDAGGAGNWGQVTEIRGLDAATSDQFGLGMAMQGDRLVIAAPYHDYLLITVGAAWVFERDAGGPGDWGQVAKLIPADGGNLDRFGFGVGLHGDTVVIGSYEDDDLGSQSGSAYVFERDAGGPGNWGQAKKLLASDGGSGDRFGRFAAAWGDTLAIGADGYDTPPAAGAGVVYVFERDLGGPGAWGERARLQPEDVVVGDAFARVALCGDTLLAGATTHDHVVVDGGAAYVFRRHHGGANRWGQVAELMSSDVETQDYFGRVALDGNTALIGATGEDSLGSSAGAAYVFDGLDYQPAAAYCTAGTTASGCQALISSSGQASASQPSGFDVLVSGSEGQKDGLLYFGVNGPQAAPWGNGTSYQCVVPPVVRTGVQGGVGTGGGCDGSFQLDFNAWMAGNAAKAPPPGAVAFLQAWFRDPASTSNQSTSLSDALSFTVCP